MMFDDAHTHSFRYLMYFNLSKLSFFLNKKVSKTLSILQLQRDNERENVDDVSIDEANKIINFQAVKNIYKNKK